MQLIRRPQTTWNPLKELEDFSNRWNNYFASPSITSPEINQESLVKMDWIPACNISETHSKHRIRAERPNKKKMMSAS